MPSPPAYNPPSNHPSTLNHDHDLDADMLDKPSSPPTPSSSSSNNIAPRPLSTANEKVLAYINETFTSIIAKLEEPRPPFEEPRVVLRRVVSVERGDFGGRLGVADGNGDVEDGCGYGNGKKVRSREVRVDWPGRDEREAWRFACLLCIFSEIREALLEGRIVTKRDIYYRQPELFKTQSTVDRWIDDIAFTCGVSRRDLMVSASPKGLICGLSDIERVQTVPVDFDHITAEDVQHLRWIIVIEKEASFNQLVESLFDYTSCLGPGLLVTAKGYPDLQTRYFLRHILDSYNRRNSVSLPIFGIFDSDPDGLEIYRCYHSGSKSSSQESACDIPEMNWLGVKIFDFLSNRKVMTEAVDLTKRDRARAQAMLRRIDAADMGGRGAEMRRALQIMLMLGKKMEIQAVDRGHYGGLCGWLEGRMLVVRESL